MKPVCTLPPKRARDCITGKTNEYVTACFTSGPDSNSEEKITDIKRAKELLNGCVTKMCVENDLETLERTKEWAHKRVDTIYTINYERIMEGNNK